MNTKFLYGALDTNVMSSSATLGCAHLMWVAEILSISSLLLSEGSIVSAFSTTLRQIFMDTLM